jgi:hypothetical protein
MSRRTCPALLGVALLLLTAGCVEQTQIITLNPDGRGKIQIEARMPGQAPLNFAAGPGGGGKEKTLDQMLQEALAKELSRKGITAWKDVSAKWDADGRFYFAGTAYFERLDDLWKGQKNEGMPFEQFALTVDKDKGLKLRQHKDDSGKKKPRPDFSKMTDKEMDEFVMKERVKYQSTKGILTAMLTDMRLKTTFRLPGEPRDIKGFKKDGDRVVSRDLDGNALLAAIKKTMAQDNATLKKLYKEAKSPEALEFIGAPEHFTDASLTVPRRGAAQFDYDKEVKDARAAYPALRKRLKLGAKTTLPGE